MIKNNIERENSDYKVRILSCLVIVEIIAIAIVNLWPASDNSGNTVQEISFSQEDYAWEEIQITRHESRPPPPPKPQVPVPVPNDEIIEEIPDLEDIDLSEFTDPLSEERMGEPGDTGRLVADPQSGPSVIRIVEPTTPDEAKRANIKVEVWVTFLVDQQGSVEDANISEIRLYDENGEEYETVESIGYGIIESTLKAALQWKFRPATDNGEPVKTYTRHIFTYGFN